MIKRSECKCLCHSEHTDLIGTHKEPCCEPDQPRDLNKALSDLLDEEWNSAIEAVVEIATCDYHVTAEEIRKLKRSVGK